MPRMTPLSSNGGLLYESLAARLAEAIDTGRVKAGERLPSVRTLSRQYGVSISTAVQAYRHLEDKRVIEARPKSGYFAAPPRPALPEPRESKPPQSARYVQTSPLFVEYFSLLDRQDIIPLGALRPDPSLLPTQKLATLLGTTARRYPELSASYSASAGTERLRRTIARRALDYGCSFDAGDVVITDGCVDALNLCLRAVARPGDTIALESPTYFTMLQMIESLGMKAFEIPTNPRTGLSLEALEFATRKKGTVRALMITPSFTNPTGALMPDANRKALAELCEKRGIPIIEDDVYSDTWFGEARPLPIKAWDRTGNVLLCSSFSKTVAPGFRVGWAVAGRYREAVSVLKRIGSIFTPPIPQLALCEFMETGGFDHHLRRLRQGLAGRQQQLAHLVAETFPEGTRVSRPTGGYVTWVELPNRVDAVELFRRARDENILLAPGPLFTTTGRFRNAMRLNYGTLWSRATEQAIARVGRMAAAF
ncbi:Histidinol-phosphate aminotransferase [Usitatibacter rugosus]|uniref:Histidinol-phosphate aminotransferase n=2 Tax=Usitatibacter rugosus TaxID=2732067 RepID=A0A6M4GRM8_9PROT|nr:Histidinol-phosphate aminotransferase [Usitatibacter rugosus]